MNGAANRRRGRDGDDDGAKTQQRHGHAMHVRPRTDNNVNAAAGHLSHPFRAEFNDHFETSMEALRDIAVVVEQLRLLLRPSTPEKFAVYDPYYCAGTVVQHWNALGVQRVIHENRDFYKDIAEDKVPREYDMLVTNPPFSGDHIERLFSHLVAAKKPFAFLVPSYTATKKWYRAAVRRHFTTAPPTGKGDITASPGRRLQTFLATLQPPPFVKTTEATGDVETTHGARGDSNTQDKGQNDGESLPIGTEPFYLIPRCCYDFKHPKDVGNEHSHFHSMWFVWAGRRTMEVLRGARVEFARMQRDVLTERRVVPDVVHGLDALAEGHYVQVGARPNPQRRAKQRQLRR